MIPNYATTLTDGSKDGDTAGPACVTPSDTLISITGQCLYFFSGDQSY